MTYFKSVLETKKPIARAIGFSSKFKVIEYPREV